ncbi:low molecular weight protein-tyrosine-phosphatase [soil metagenome]
MSYICRMKILMVCLGNICRSPLAEGILREKAKKAGLNWEIKSAGTNSYHTGEPPHKLSQKVATEKGIDISAQRARRFLKTDCAAYDKVYAMAGDVMEDMRTIAGDAFDDAKVELLLNEAYPGQNRDVPDPWSGPESGYHEAFNLINNACDAIIDNYVIAQKKTAQL